MSQLYVWQPSGMEEQEAHRRFEHRLEKQTAFYNEHLSTSCRFRCVQVGSVLVGQIAGELGIREWNPWQESGQQGVAWAGVCEDYLGVESSPLVIEGLTRKVIERPETLADLTGSFSVCAWDARTQEVGVITAATQPQTLWRTEGPTGIAIGSRAAPLLDLVGRETMLDEEEASLFLTYKYLMGKGGLFRHVARIPARRHIRLTREGVSAETVYESLTNYLGDALFATFEEAVEHCADRLAARVERQIRFSENPVINLTGGRDSRCIAAALAKSGFSGPASTAGDNAAPDVIGASHVARTIGFEHLCSGVSVGHNELLERLRDGRNRARTWTRISESVETIRHGLHYPDFFHNTAPFPSAVIQAFNGLHAGLQKPISHRHTPERLNKWMGGHLVHHGAIKERFEEMRSMLNTELSRLDAPISRWSQLHYWQIHALQWGQDNRTVKDLFAWWWTPLLDQELIRAAWHLPAHAHESTRFVEAITLRLNPGLRGVPYEDQIGRPETGFVRRTTKAFRRRTGSLRNRLGLARQDTTQEARRKELWEAVLFPSPEPAWKRWIDEAFVRDAMSNESLQRMLWKVATVQLVVEAWNLDGHVSNPPSA